MTFKTDSPSSPSASLSAPPSADDFAPLLEARDLSCARGGRRLFSGVGFALNGEEWIQVSGGNGAGKTSLLRILCGLREPDAGEVLWRGVPLRRAAEDYFSDLAFVGHRDGVKLKMTPLENLRAWSEARGEGGAMISAALETVGLSRAAGTLCANISAGQRRRAALARLLLTSARVWILDEPLAALDADGRQMVSQLLREHLREGGAAAIATHQPFPPDLPRPQTLTLGR